MSCHHATSVANRKDGWMDGRREGRVNGRSGLASEYTVFAREAFNGLAVSDYCTYM
jgi:hypothetical protein